MDNAPPLAERLNAGIKHKERGDFNRAASLLESVIDERPDHAEAHHQLGLVYTFMGRPEDGIEELRTALHLCPESVPYRIDLGRTYVLIGDYENAISYVRPDDRPGGAPPDAGVPTPRLPVTPVRTAGNPRRWPPEEG